MEQRTDTIATETSMQTLPQYKEKNEANGKNTTTLSGPISPQEAQQRAYLYPAQVILHALDSDAQKGLNEKQVESKLLEYGENALDGGDEINHWKILFHQIANAMTLVLILAFAVSLGIQSWIEGGVLAFVVLVNIFVGFFQELGAEKTTSALKNLASPTARVIRSGQGIGIQASMVVPGDIVELTMGDTVPADIRIIEAVNLEADEALLTGESVPVAKDGAALSATQNEEEEIGVGDRINMAFSSSSITKGRATGVVIGTGMKTEIGRIADALRGAARNEKIREIKRNTQGKRLPHHYVHAGAMTVYDKLARFLGLTKGTPLQRKLSSLAIVLFFIAVLFAIVVFLANLSEYQVSLFLLLFSSTHFYISLQLETPVHGSLGK
jgi:Na+-exporting ATPase